MSNRLRFPMFLKFLIGCLVLAGVLIYGGASLVKDTAKMKSRGNYLKKHFKRYKSYQEAVGTAISSAVDRIAASDELARALGRAAAGDVVAPTGPSAADIGAREMKLLSRENALQPDLFAIIGFKPDRLAYASKGSVISADDLADAEPITRLRTGGAYFNKVLLHKGRAIQISGVAVKNGDGEAVGGVILGVDLTRYMLDYKEQSDDKEKMKHRLTLVDKSGDVIASVMPKDDWKELGEQLEESKWIPVKLGEETRPIIRLKAGDYDFYHESVEGFAGMTAGTVGQLFLMRSRSNLAKRDDTIPWTEITIGIVLSIIIAGVLAFWITRPIKKFVRQSQEMLEGRANLDHRIEIGSRDEVQDLAENINKVFGRLYSLASDVQQASFHVGASSAEISAASKQMLGGLKDQTLKIEGSTAAVTELSASIQQVATNAVEATKVAEKSNVAVTSAVQRMQQIRGAVEDSATKIRELGESGKRIGNIVEVIRQISEQTSLLALNASIEAAHAGEQGRGFAVVADEVSSLARRVGQSAKDIEDLIQTIKEQTAEAVQAMQVGTSEVETGTELVTVTLQDLKQLIGVVNDTAAAVQEQAVVSDEIARNMDAVQKIAAEMLAGSEEAVVQGEQLHELAFGLEQSVGGFNLEAASLGNRRALRDKSS